jgi:nitrite reductase/ring-hydroxylating ferredoxin subunit
MAKRGGVSGDKGLDVCDLEALADGGALGFEYTLAGAPRAGFLVRRGAAVFAYRNVCPHAGNPLNWKPDAFLTRDRQRIMCSVHGALFEIESGLCVAGPCTGRSLTALRAEIRDGRVIVFAGD